MREVLLVAGARPNFMKVAPLYAALRADGRLEPRLVHTGQHYDPVLSDRIMADLELPAPDFHLGTGPGTPSQQLARILEAMDDLLRQQTPRLVVVVGDVTSTLAASLAALNLNVPVAHVEAGLRSFDWSMPEERNRVLVDRVSRWRFATEPAALCNLAAEGITGGVHLCGNVMIDSLLRVLPRARETRTREHLGLPEHYGVLTMHRPGNVDDQAHFGRTLRALAPITAQVPVVYPVHPRARASLDSLELPDGFRCIDPLGYLDFVGLVADATLVLTDSGGLQEETTALGVPCMTLRPNTERPITIELGTNELVGADEARIRELGQRALDGSWKKGSIPDGWDGHAAERIVTVLADALA